MTTRELLEQVIRDGQPAQQAAAHALLSVEPSPETDQAAMALNDAMRNDPYLTRNPGDRA